MPAKRKVGVCLAFKYIEQKINKNLKKTWRQPVGRSASGTHEI